MIGHDSAEASRYHHVPLVASSGSSPDAIRADIDAWIKSEPLVAMLATEGANPTGSLAERLAYLDGLTTAAWDFRGMEARAKKARAAVGGPDGHKVIERNQVRRDLVAAEREAPILEAATALGMVEPASPKYNSYDWVLILGGLVRACVWRTQYAAHLINQVVTCPNVVALTAFRDLARNAEDPQQDEPTLLAEAGLHSVEHEAEVVEEAILDAFSNLELSVIAEGNGTVGGDRFKVASGASRGASVTLVAAPNPKSEYRANTGQTMEYWATEIARLEPGQRILNVTSAIYVPFQHAAAVQNLALPYGVEIDTVGIDHAHVKPVPSAQVFSAVNYLQEMRSAIISYRHLLAAVDAASGKRPGRMR